MRRSAPFIVPMLGLALGACCQSPRLALDPDAELSRPVATYSIVARDGATGRLGVGVQSHWFSVGSVVPWAEAGVGAVATQSLVNVTYGPLGLELMRGGRTAGEALEALRSTDDGSALRQVAMVDAAGNVAAHTGDRCIAEAGQRTGRARDGTVYSVQANLMARETVPRAMAEAFEAAPGDDFAQRLFAALEAAQGEGGDIRGKQSAAMLIVEAEPSGRPWDDVVLDLHVHDHPEPLRELERLLLVHRAYEHMNAGDLAIERGDVQAALHEYSAAQELQPDNTEMVFWTAVSLVNAGRVDQAEPLLARCYADPTADWRETLRRLPAAGILPEDRVLIERLLAIEPSETR